MPSVSNLQALEDERTELLNNLKFGPAVGKSAKEAVLRRVREIERELGIKSVPYNSSEFGR